MALTIYNTLTRRKELFEPIEPGRVRMYNCGPTVYSQAHIGNFRAFLFADVLRRWLEVYGLDVRQIMNLTDVGHLREEDEAEAGSDRMELAAKKEGLDPWKIAEKYIELFFTDVDALGITRAHVYPRATEFIPQQIELAQTLVDAGAAYVVDGEVYFSVGSFAEYGRLSGNTPEDLLAGARVDVNDKKRDPRDFALWKQDAAHIMQWDSPWGRGFPGWHLECSAMSQALLGDSLDIHTGGEDNIFPHHECEIAQSESATGKPFVKYWMHTRFLQVEGGKMSKTLGNLYTVEELAQKGYPPVAVRFALIRSHYRQVLNFTFEGLDQAATAVRRLRLFADEMTEAAGDSRGPSSGDPVPEWVTNAVRQFDDAMNDDLNVSAALDGVFSLMSEAHRARATGLDAAAALSALRRFDRVLGVLEPPSKTADVLDSDIEKLIFQRNEARAAKDYALSDKIRDDLLSQGIELVDTKDGVKWRRAGV